MKLNEITKGQTVTCTDAPGSTLTVDHVEFGQPKGCQRMVIVTDSNGASYKAFARNLTAL